MNVIPAPFPAGLVEMLLVIAAVCCGAGAFMIARKAKMLFGCGAPAQRRLTVTTVLALVVSIGLSGGSVGAAIKVETTHDSVYSAAVWRTLSSDYGLAPSADRESIVEGRYFPATLDGKPVSCTVRHPDLVVCDGHQVSRHKA